MTLPLALVGCGGGGGGGDGHGGTSTALRAPVRSRACQRTIDELHRVLAIARRSRGPDGELARIYATDQLNGPSHFAVLRSDLTTTLDQITAHRALRLTRPAVAEIRDIYVTTERAHARLVSIRLSFASTYTMWIHQHSAAGNHAADVAFARGMVREKTAFLSRLTHSRLMVRPAVGSGCDLTGVMPVA